MIIWTIKLLSNLRRAIAGRRYPSQLAWAVAFGLLLGIVPHGNVLAVLLLVLVLTLKLNHAMAGLTAIAATFGATYLDPYTHRIGDSLLSSPDVSSIAATAWTFPLVPWTDLNNTIVLGSFVLGLLALVPVFLLTYPLFKLIAWIAPVEDEADAVKPKKQKRKSAATPASESGAIVKINDGHDGVGGPNRRNNEQPSRTRKNRRRGERQPARGRRATQTAATASTDSRRVADANEAAPPDQSRPQTIPSEHFKPVAADAKTTETEPNGNVTTSNATAENSGNHVAVETRIDVIRMKDYQRPAAGKNETGVDNVDSADQEPMDEALSYLLRQLRDSQQRKAA